MTKRTREQLENQIELLRQVSENEDDYGEWLKLQNVLNDLELELLACLAAARKSKFTASSSDHEIHYRVTKPKPKKHGIQTTNPFGHTYPHAKLRNVTLTSITRLNKPGAGFPRANYREYLIENADPRNFTLSRAKEEAQTKHAEDVRETYDTEFGS